MERVVVVVAFLCQAAVFVSTVEVTSTRESDGSSSGQLQGLELYVLLMTSASQGFNSSRADSAVRLALDRINGDASILPGYELQLAGVRDTKVKLVSSYINS